MISKDNLFLESIYLDMILEKDHRGKMLSFGVPQDVADYLHNFDDKYSLWFADKINKMEDFKKSQNKINWINVNILTKMQGIIDWVRNVPNINLKQFNWDQAVDAQEKYHESLQTSSLEGQETNTILKKYDDGFYWVDLESRNSCEESGAMGHCGRTSKGDTLYSLRKYTPQTQQIDPVVTMAISPDEGTWYQCKGKKNSKPKEEYFKYIADILIEKGCFKFKYEYDSSHDFTDKDLKEYVEENSETIANSDEILQKIEEGSVTLADFKKILKEYEFKHFDLYLDEYDEGEHAYVTIYCTISFKFSDFEEKIPNIREIIKEHEGEYFRELDNFNDFFQRFDVYDGGNGIRIDSSEDGFYISTDVEESDNAFQMDDNGLSSFNGTCRQYSNMDESIDMGEAISKFTFFMGKEGWIEDKYEDFIDSLENVDKERNKDNDYTITFSKFQHPLWKYKEKISWSDYFGLMNIRSHRDMNEDELSNYPYIQYTLDFFKFLLNDYMRVSYSINVGARKAYTWRSDITGDLYFKSNYIYDEKDDYNFDFEKSSIEKVQNNIEDISQKFEKFCEEIIVPDLEQSKKLNIDDVFFKKEEMVPDYLEYQKIPIYSKENGLKIKTISGLKIKPEDSDEKIREVISGSLETSNDLMYPRYDRKKSENFFKENFSKQATFKEYVESLDKKLKRYMV